MKFDKTMIDIKRLIHPDFSEVGRSGDSYNFMSIVKMMRAERNLPPQKFTHKTTNAFY